MVTLDEKKKSQILFYILIKTKIVGTGKNCNIEVVLTFTYTIYILEQMKKLCMQLKLLFYYVKSGV